MKKIHAFAIFLFPLFAASSCKLRQFNSSVVQNTTNYWLDINDVSFLYPPPQDDTEAATKLLHLNQSAGKLLGRELFDASIQTTKSNAPDKPSFDWLASYDKWTIVSVRVDPCFPKPDIDHPENCKKQVRLVAQYWREDAEIGYTARNDALHLIYEPENFDEVAKEIFELKALAGKTTTKHALGIHPILQKEKGRGTYTEKLNALILKACIPSTLREIAVMLDSNERFVRTVTPTDTTEHYSNLTFMRADVVNEKLRVQTVPNTNAKSIAFVDGKFVPEPTKPNTIGFTKIKYDEVRLGNNAAFEKSAAATIDDSHQIENPLLENPKSTDCISCHNATWGRLRFQEVTGQILSDVQSNKKFIIPSDYTNIKPDEHAAVIGFGIMRAFGYSGSTAAVSMRTINDSVMSARFLNKYYKK